MKNKVIYRCKECNYETVSWTGKCPNCSSWGSLKEIEVSDSKGKNKKNLSKKEATKLKDVKIDSSERIVTSIGELNRVLGGGIVRDSVTILTARPGAGKSTLFLEMSYDLASKGIKVLYISGEESESQIKSRAIRTMQNIPNNIWIVSTTSMDLAIENIKNINPDIIFLDSIQTFTLSEYTSRAGSPVQTVECANTLVDIAKNKDNPKAVFMIGHMTKSDEMAGLRTLEHLVDTVIYLEGEVDESLRVLMSTKNRFGRIGEIGLFEMRENGIKEIDNISNHFVTERENLVPGSALSMIKEGSRMMVVEIESLVSKSFLPYPTRIGDSLRKDQLNTLISILEERGNTNLYDKNVIIKTTGGIKLSEQSVNLAIIMSIISAYKNKGIDNKTVFIAEVGLTGELKKVPQIENRIEELSRLGYKRVFTFNNTTLKDINNIEVVQCETLQEVINKIF
ncbi:DNA repair protein RadA [Miniphocaeibacter massiliensis]|uniref:DNA repair protein RadA n=1 Tax=Miniphocaeibacter massiliensis TaxID=2041841 RepID=UPI000C1BA7C5|nr:DNA repair protein RadA [Miniphocaeibacter massiliensis]